MHRMMIAVGLLLVGASSASAQEWAKKMFKTTSHDFGVVARGGKAEFAFEFVNEYEEDIHIAGVRSSCGCTTPKVINSTAKTWQKGAILATFNTRSFLGQKAATLTVIIDRPFPAEVQLTVKGFIRSDIVIEPGVVDLGEVESGEPVTKNVRISYAGRADWKIVDVQSDNRNFEVEILGNQRTEGRVTYELAVRLAASAPAGDIHDELTLVTNDQEFRTFALPIEGRVNSAITVSPAALFLGVLSPGESITKRLVVRSKKPFRIKHVTCSDNGFKFGESEGEKTLHFVPVTFVAGDEQGKVVQTIEIETESEPGKLTAAKCVATATISP